MGAAWKPDRVSASIVSQFVDVLAQTCAGENAGALAPGIKVKQTGSHEG